MAPLVRFFEGSVWYNGAMLLGTFAALAFGLWQLSRVKRAAKAAEGAAQKTEKRVDEIATVVDAKELQKLAQLSVLFIQQEEFAAAWHFVQGLRNGLTELRQSPTGKGLMSKKEWQELINEMRNLHWSLNSDGPLEGRAKERCLKSLSNTIETLSGMTAKAVNKTGGR